MPNELSQIRKEILSTLYEKMKSESLSWRSSSENSYTSDLDGARIDIDKRPMHERMSYVTWILGADSKVIDRIYDYEAFETPFGYDDIASYGQLIQVMFNLAEKQLGESKLSTVLKKLKEK